MMQLPVNTRRVNGVAKLFGRLWDDDAGALLATEWVVIATIMVLGLIPGLVAVRQGTLSELTEFGNATMALNQSYSFSGQTLGCDPGTGTPNGRNALADGRTGNRGPNTANVISQRHNPDPRLTGAPGTNAALVGARTDVFAQGGVQAVTAGSAAVQVRDDFGKRLNLRATPSVANPIDQPACD
jgi:hypothetical protein